MTPSPHGHARGDPFRSDRFARRMSGQIGTPDFRRAANTPRPADFVEEKRSFSDSYLTIRRCCIKIYHYRRNDGAGVRPAAAGQRRTPLAGSVRAERPEDSAGAGAATPAAGPDAETRGKRKRRRRFEFGWHHEAMRLSSQNREDGRFFDARRMFHAWFSR